MQKSLLQDLPAEGKTTERKNIWKMAVTKWLATHFIEDHIIMQLRKSLSTIHWYAMCLTCGMDMIGCWGSNRQWLASSIPTARTPTKICGTCGVRIDGTIPKFGGLQYMDSHQKDIFRFVLSTLKPLYYDFGNPVFTIHWKWTVSLGAFWEMWSVKGTKKPTSCPNGRSIFLLQRGSLPGRSPQPAKTVSPASSTGCHTSRAANPQTPTTWRPDMDRAPKNRSGPRWWFCP